MLVRESLNEYYENQDLSKSVKRENWDEEDLDAVGKFIEFTGAGDFIYKEFKEYVEDYAKNYKNEYNLSEEEQGVFEYLSDDIEKYFSLYQNYEMIMHNKHLAEMMDKLDKYYDNIARKEDIVEVETIINSMSKYIESAKYRLGLK